MSHPEQTSSGSSMATAKTTISDSGLRQWKTYTKEILQHSQHKVWRLHRYSEDIW